MCSKWLVMLPDTDHDITFPGLVDDEPPLIAPSDSQSRANLRNLQNCQGVDFLLAKKWKPFCVRTYTRVQRRSKREWDELDGYLSESDMVSPWKSDANFSNGANSVSEDENVDHLADFKDEDSHQDCLRIHKIDQWMKKPLSSSPKPYQYKLW